MASRTSSNELADSVNTRPTTVGVSVPMEFVCTVRIATLSASTEAMTSSASACG
jgi:hypothetical protein